MSTSSGAGAVDVGHESPMRFRDREVIELNGYEFERVSGPRGYLGIDGFSGRTEVVREPFVQVR